MATWIPTKHLLCGNVNSILESRYQCSPSLINFYCFLMTITPPNLIPIPLIKIELPSLKVFLQFILRKSPILVFFGLIITKSLKMDIQYYAMSIKGENLGPFSICFQFLNNIICIFTQFFHSHIFPKNTNNITQTLLPNKPLIFRITLTF